MFKKEKIMSIKVSEEILDDLLEIATLTFALKRNNLIISNPIIDKRIESCRNSYLKALELMPENADDQPS